MSYAHEIFGVKETRYDIWKQDLMLAGTSSATFNSDRMREIASSAFVKDDGFAGYYMLLWCKYNNVPLSEVMRVGQKVAIQNNDYGTVDNYVLNYIDSTAAYFVSANFVGYMPTLVSESTFYDGNSANTVIGSWLKAETPNWHASIVPSANGVGALVGDYGYMHGLPEEFKDILKQNATMAKCPWPLIDNDAAFLYNDYYKLGVRNTFGPTAIHTAKIISNGNLASNMKLGSPFWCVLVPESSTQNNAYPLVGATWHQGANGVSSLAQANALQVQTLPGTTVSTLTLSSFPKLNASTPHFARFAVEY